jgi:ATP-dependent helicase/nuclease subunit A
LTFTKAAALEMKQRLVESLDQRIQVCDASLKGHLEKQKLLLNDAYITNFHSFCSDLLSQYGYMIHLNSKFEIIENPTLIKENILMFTKMGSKRRFLYILSRKLYWISI